MKRMKNEKGITLVALIITIVVLLILAVVAVTGVKQDGIFSHANNAATKYNSAIKDENGTIANLGNWVIKFDNGTTHTWGEWKVITQANCKTETNGSKERECSVCGEKETQVISWENAHEQDVAMSDTTVCTGKGTHYVLGPCYYCGKNVFNSAESTCSYIGHEPKYWGQGFYCEENGIS